MLNVCYGVLGIPLSDFEIEKVVDEIIEFYKTKDINCITHEKYRNQLCSTMDEENVFVYTCNEAVLLCFQLRAMEGKINTNDIFFCWDKKNGVLDIPDIVELKLHDVCGIMLPDGVKDEDFSPRFKFMEDFLKISHEKVKKRIADRCKAKSEEINKEKEINKIKEN